MTDTPEHIARYRQLAAELRTKAHATADPQERESLLKDADIWEGVAAREVKLQSGSDDRKTSKK